VAGVAAGLGIVAEYVRRRNKGVGRIFSILKRNPPDPFSLQRQIEATLMISRRRAIGGLVLAGVATVAQASCSRFFFIRPEGKLTGPVTFYFLDSPDAKRPSTMPITRLTVERRQSDGIWTKSWELRGKASLEAVVYGQTYFGLAETQPAETLITGVEYRVGAQDAPRFNPPGRGGASFFFDTDGGLVQTGP
jgi:hypothetical protein